MNDAYIRVYIHVIGPDRFVMHASAHSLRLFDGRPGGHDGGGGGGGGGGGEGGQTSIGVY